MGVDIYIYIGDSQQGGILQAYVSILKISKWIA